MSIKEKVVIITGGASGMGKSHVKRLVKEGCKVVFTDLNEELSYKLVQELNDLVLFIKADVTSEDDWKKVVDTTLKNYGRIDALVNNAGIGGNLPIEEMPLDMYMKVLNVDLVSAFLGMKYVIPQMKKQQSGSIINIASINAYGGSSFGAAYNSAKWGMRGLTKTGTMELAKYGIRCNTILPGLVETPLVTSPQYSELYNQFQEAIPQKRAAQDYEISGTIVYLISDDSSYVNGAEIAIDGGTSSQNHALSEFVLSRTGVK